MAGVAGSRAAMDAAEKEDSKGKMNKSLQIALFVVVCVVVLAVIVIAVSAAASKKR